MNLRRQLLLVSLLILVLPWAGCQFIRETESALREGQQRMLAGTAQAIADSLSQFPDELRRSAGKGVAGQNQLYGHPLHRAPLIDGYVDDWGLPPTSFRRLRGTDGAIRFVTGIHRKNLYLYVDTRDASAIYAAPGAAGGGRKYHDFVSLISATGSESVAEFVFETEAPGDIVVRRLQDAYAFDEPRIAARWQDTPGGYQLEARIPLDLLGDRLGVIVTNTANATTPGIASASFSATLPGRFVTTSPVLESVAKAYAQPGLRLIITDPTGWRLAQAGAIRTGEVAADQALIQLNWRQLAFSYLLEPGSEATLAGPHPSGREQQNYVSRALNAEPAEDWFRSSETGRAVVAVAQPIWSGNVQTGVLIMQQGTDAILALTNESLARLMNLTLIATLLAASVLLGYSSWLSMRIRRLSNAAIEALDEDSVQRTLPSASASDEIGDLSRSFSHVLRQLGDYNDYLKTLAGKLSHELRTPLTIVTSSLENLEHEVLTPESANYTARARDGARRLQNILNAMSEASRVEELMQHAEPEPFDLAAALAAVVAAYSDAWPERQFVFNSNQKSIAVLGSPELIIQMLDKLVDNAVDFSAAGDRITIELLLDAGEVRLSVSNPGPPLPERMRSQLFDSMISVRKDHSGDHLGLGLHIAWLIAEGHGGSIMAENVDDGVRFKVRFPAGSI